MTAPLMDRLAEGARWLYVESRCTCQKCHEARIEVARALVEYDENKVRYAALARAVEEAFATRESVRETREPV